jgi:uncharacterized OB-fold protein
VEELVEREELFIKKRAPGTLAVKIPLRLPVSWPTGPYMGRFLKEIKENEKIWGIKCPKCKRIIAPPRMVCGSCHLVQKEWVPLGNEGTLLYFSVVFQRFTDPQTGEERRVPYAWGVIQLDGGGVINHYLSETEITKLLQWRGKRVRAVFKDKKDRNGDFWDIKYFTLIEE